MRNISFKHTALQILYQSKTVTRRNGWAFAEPQMPLQPILQGQGLAKGETVQNLGCPIVLTSVDFVPLSPITQEEVSAEGFPDWTPANFVIFYCKNMNVEAHTTVTRMTFAYSQNFRVFHDRQRGPMLVFPLGGLPWLALYSAPIKKFVKYTAISPDRARMLPHNLSPKTQRGFFVQDEQGRNGGPPLWGATPSPWNLEQRILGVQS